MNVFEKHAITQQDFEKKERAALEHIKKTYTDFYFAEKALREKDYRRCLESILILSFVVVDTMSRFHEIVEAEKTCSAEVRRVGSFPLIRYLFLRQRTKSNNEERFCKWINKFVLSDRNPIYKIDKENINLDSKLIWKLRNSLVHFYGLPSLRGGKGQQIMLVNGPWNNPSGKRLQELHRTAGLDLRIIDVDGLRRAIYATLEPWFGYLLEVQRNDPVKYVEAFLKIHKVTSMESSVKFDLRTGTRI